MYGIHAQPKDAMTCTRRRFEHYFISKRFDSYATVFVSDNENNMQSYVYRRIWLFSICAYAKKLQENMRLTNDYVLVAY